MSKKNLPKKGKKQKTSKRKNLTPTNKSFWQQPSLYIPALLILLVTAIAFSPSLSNDFVNWDDDVNVLENENLQSFSAENIKKIFSYETGTIIGNYNPLPIFTFLVDKELLGGYDGNNWNPRIFHINNLLLHLFCVFMVYRIMLLLKLSREAAIIAALLFGIHPMRVESVAWITERKDVLLGAFYFPAIYTYIKSLQLPEKRKFYQGITLLLFVFALFSKIQAVALPLSMLAIDYYFKRPLNFKLIIEKWPYWLMSLAFGLAGIYFLSLEGSLNLNEDVTNYGIHDRLAVGAFSYCIYLVKFIFPYEMSPLYPYVANLPWYYWACLAVIPFKGYFVFKAFQQKWRAVVFAFSFFTVNVMFLLQVLGAGQGLKADRFTYIPYMGLFFLLAWGYDAWQKKKPAQTMFLNVGIGAYLLLFTVMTFQQTKIWENGGTLWTHVLKYYDQTTLPWGNRARYYRETAKNPAKAEADYKKAISLKASGELHNSLGKTYFDTGRTDLAIAEYTKAINMKSTEAEFFVNRGAAYGSKGNLQAALNDLNKGVEADAEFANAYLNRSLVFNNLQQYENALKDHEVYLNLKPFNADIWYEKGITHHRLGDRTKALEAFNRAIELKNTQPIFFVERGKVHVNSGNKAAGMQDFQRAQALGFKVDPAILDRAR
ncbi:MAG: tetratricopeptide repeat protein [Saprospiraceae bacterium]